jgi:chromosome segregation ATPase
MKKKELSELVTKLDSRATLLESRLILVPENWGTVVEKFKELEAKIGRIESLERTQTQFMREYESLRQWLKDLENKLENYKHRMTAVEKRWPVIPKVVKEDNAKKSSG